MGKARLSTIFAGPDAGRPTVGRSRYETKIFGGQLDGKTERYNTRDEAEAGHSRWVAVANGEATP